MDGILILDKPTGMTSRDAVTRLHAQLPRRTKIGHTGTLDPLATGLLVLCLGHATRLVEYVQDLDKVYHTRIRLGVRSDTDDADGEVTPVIDAEMPMREMIEAALVDFHGIIDQTPPAYSAAKIDGQRAYNLARTGQEVTLTAKPVRIDSITIESYTPPLLELTIRCGKGTYIRSLARDLGERLGCGGIVETLRRTAVGHFSTVEAVHLDADVRSVRAAVEPTERAVAHLPHIEVTPEQAIELRNGQFLFDLTLPTIGTELVMMAGADFVGIGLVGALRELRPVKVFLRQKGI